MERLIVGHGLPSVRLDTGGPVKFNTLIKNQGGVSENQNIRRIFVLVACARPKEHEEVAGESEGKAVVLSAYQKDNALNVEYIDHNGVEDVRDSGDLAAA